MPFRRPCSITFAFPRLRQDARLGIGYRAINSSIFGTRSGILNGLLTTSFCFAHAQSQLCSYYPKRMPAQPMAIACNEGVKCEVAYHSCFQRGLDLFSSSVRLWRLSVIPFPYCRHQPWHMMTDRYSYDWHVASQFALCF